MLLKKIFLQLQKIRIIGFLCFLFQRVRYFSLNQVASSLTYTTLLALVPFFTIIFIVIKAFPMFQQFTLRINDFITMFLVPSGASVVKDYLQEFSNKAGNLTFVGIIILLISATFLMMTIEKTFNRIWFVNKERPLLFRLLIYWTTMTLGPLCLGGLITLWNVVFKPSTFFDDYPTLVFIFYILASIAFLTLLFCMLYRIVPYRYVPFRHALLGGLVTATMFEIARHGFAFYVKNFNSYELIYGAFAILPLFLLWLFCLWYIILGGAVFTASLSHWKGEAFRREINREEYFSDVILVLAYLQQAQSKSTALKIQDFRQKINMGYDALGDLLEKLAQYGYVINTDQGWVLKTNPDNIMLDKLFSKFIYHSPPNNQNGINNEVNQLLAPSMEKMNISLSQFIKENNLVLQKELNLAV